ncbi:MAG: PAS-domain containing protein [Alphaproteobacteria bacterium]|nr:PAS-domain containing protein [Alphaproteobacteria bacterium]
MTPPNTYKAWSSYTAIDIAAMERELARMPWFNHLLMAQVGALALYDSDDRLSLFNQRHYDLWGALGSLLRPGVPYRQLLQESVRLREIEEADIDPDRWVESMIQGHRSPRGDYVHRFRDGRIVQVHNIRTAEGGTVSICTDITGVMEQEEARRLRAEAESAALLASTVTNIAQGVSVFNARRELVIWNRRACEVLNLPYYAVRRGMPVRELIRLMVLHRAKIERTTARTVRQWIRRRRPRPPLQVDLQYPGDTVVEAAFRAMPDQGFVITFSDVTADRRAGRALERHREELAAEVEARTKQLVAVNLRLQREVRQRQAAAEALELARAEAVAANQGKTRFLAAASHDLLQPLNAARLYVSALEAERNALPEAAVKTLDGLAGAFQSVEDLLGALLEISKLDVGAIQPTVSDFAVQPVLEGLVHSVAGLAAEKGLQLRAVPTSAWVRSDQALLRRILLNLLTNAVKYTREGRVVLGARRDGSDWRIEVWDTGPGIPEEDQQAIFEEFRRGTYLDSQAATGAGLGLSIVRRAVDLLGHTIRLRSWPGRGTCFRVTLPSAPPQAIVPTAAPLASVSAHNWENRLVLLLENDREIAKGMKMLFERWRCPLLTAASYEEMAEWLADEDAVPDLVIADYHLDTAIDGLTAIELLREDYPGVPAALATADRGEETAKRAAALGVERFTKPIRPAELRAFVDYCFGRGAAEC